MLMRLPPVLVVDMHVMQAACIVKYAAASCSSLSIAIAHHKEALLHDTLCATLFLLVVVLISGADSSFGRVCRWDMILLNKEHTMVHCTLAETFISQF